MAAPNRLLAKSGDHATNTLYAHTGQVMLCAVILLEERGVYALNTLGLSADVLSRLKKIVLLAALVHDLGKSSECFQAMIRGTLRTRQSLRHEAISFLLGATTPLREWLRCGVDDDLDLELALIAAAGHHRKFYRAGDLNGRGNPTKGRITCFTGHEDFRRTLRVGEAQLGLPAPPWMEDTHLSFERGEASFRARVEARRPSLTEEDQRLLAAAKGLVLCADVAGSALLPSGETPSWIREQLRQRATAEELRFVAEDRLGGEAPRPFQLAVGSSRAPVTLVRAGCGSGKTVAAWMWASRHAPRQAWFTYPTTGTTTEGFRDYLQDGVVSARLEHSRREVDLDILGSGTAESELDDRSARERDRLDALRSWGCSTLASTVDTVLGLLQCHRKGLYAWAGLAHAALVFDELHAYDDKLFGTLLRFLRDCPGTPTLLMTASLPTSRMTALQQVVAATHGGLELPVIDGPPELEMLPRYRRARADHLDEVRRTLEAGGKVLWVSNTVGRCVQASEEAQAFGIKPLIYHSRFKYEDRVDRHNAVIEAFRGTGAALVCTTQVAEMSLDLSADLLVTDLAPIPSLIQRLGRLNRRSQPANPKPAAPFVVLPFKGLPYEGALLDEASSWLERLGDDALSQAHLIHAWMPSDRTEDSQVGQSTWLDGGLLTEPGELREASPGILVLHPDDANRVKYGEVASARVAIPMGPPPSRLGKWHTWEKVKFLPVPPAGTIKYDADRGAQWQ